MSKLIRLWQNLAPGAAFELCLAPHLDRLWRLALRLRGEPADAEDLMQELLARAWTHRGTVVALDAPGPWLARVLYRLHVDGWRRLGVLRETSELEPELHEAGESCSERAVLAAVEAEGILRVVAELPEQQRVILLLHDGEGYRLEEIAVIVEAPLGTVKSRLHRARAAVRARLDGTKSRTAACLGVQG